MLFLRGYLKISPEAYCTFSVVSEGNACQEAHFIELKHLFFLLYSCADFYFIFTIKPGYSNSYPWEACCLSWAYQDEVFSAGDCNPLRKYTAWLSWLLSLMDLIPGRDLIPKRDNEIALFRQCVGRCSDPRPTAHSFAFPQCTGQARCKQKK